MNKKQTEQLKDVIIDYIYDYTLNEKVKILEGGGLKLQVDSDKNINDDEFLSSLYKKIISSKGEISFKYDYRDSIYCKLSDKGVHTKFLDRLENLGIIRKIVSESDINNAIQFLVDSSYLSRNAPIENELTLTEKGRYHYEQGKSFLNNYNDKNSIRNSNIKSTISLVVSIIAIIVTVILNMLESND